MTAMLAYITIRNTQIIQTNADSVSVRVVVSGQPLNADGSYSSQKGKRETLFLWHKNVQTSKEKITPSGCTNT